jgi:hypothetical protein
MPVKQLVEQSGFLISGCDSCNDPAYIKADQFVWGYNGMHRGGRFRVRPGLCEAIVSPVGNEVQTDPLNPQGITAFTPQTGVQHLVMAHAGIVYKSIFPFITWEPIANIKFDKNARQIIFQTGTKSTVTNADGSLTFVDHPYDILMMQDGSSRAAYWDGSNSGHLDSSPTSNQTPIGSTMLWNSERLWVCDGHKLHASNLGDPLTFTEETVVATGGFFVLPDEITAIGETPDLQALLVYTNRTTTTFQSAILDRTQWPTTPQFQRLLFKQIGCTGPKGVVNQYGLTWWMSYKGIISLDIARQTFIARRLKYGDYGVMRSKVKLFHDLRGVCCGEYENFLFFSWPTSDRFNAHTIVMDQLAYEGAQQAQSEGSSTWCGAWKGIRPVEWVTFTHNGVDNVITLSRDYAPTIGSNYRIGIWHAFCPQRADVLLDGTVTRIPWGMEARQLMFTADVKKITTFEVMVSELRNQSDWTLSFNGRMTGFTAVGTKHIDASQFSPDLTVIDEFRSQQRSMRANEILIANSTYVTAQGKYQQAIDLGFGILVQAVGEGAIDLIRVFADPQPQHQLGICEINETKARLVSWDNIEEITNEPPAPVFPQISHGGFVETITQRWIEPYYTSRP